MSFTKIGVSPELIEIIQLIGTFLLGWLTRRLTPKKKDTN